MADLQNSLVSVIIVTAGEENYILSCLESLRKQAYPFTEIIIIDNGLGQELKSRILREFPQVKIFPGPETLSYSASLNRGIAQSRGDYILCLNDDVRLSPGFILNGRQGFSLDDKIGIISGKILRFNEKLIDSAGLTLSPWLTARERGYGRPDQGQFENSGYVFGATGAAAFYRRSMLEEIKDGQDYFDPDFKLFYEDLDVAWRANHAGWKGYYQPSAVAYHLRGGTVRIEKRGIDKRCARLYLNDDLYFNLVRNRYLTIAKNVKFTDLLLRLPLVAIYELAAWSLIIFSRPRLLSRFFTAPVSLAYLLKKRLRVKR